MHQLPGSDSVFLAMETGDVYGHTGGLSILDPSDAPGFDFERLVSFTAERLTLAPRFSWKLREVPFGLDRPYWMEDPDFDPRNHFRRIAVPAPGGLRELAELVGYLFSQPLDRRRPLWEIWFIEGVADGRVALFMKVHHCLMDGVSGAGLGELLCDLDPTPQPIEPPERSEVEQGPGSGPSEWQLMLRTAGFLARAPMRWAGLSRQFLRQGAAMLAAAVDPDGPPLPFQVQALSFNGEIGPDRGFASASVSLDEVKQVKKHFDVTVNDVLLALTGSALRRWLDARGELPGKPLVAVVPVSTRAEGDSELGNQVSGIAVSWATDVEDPVERLLCIHRNVASSKGRESASLVDTLPALGDYLAPAMLQMFVRLSSSSAPLPGNVVVSTIRATPVPLYTAGARLESMYPMSLLAPGQGLNVTAVSYMGKVDFGLTFDPELVPAPWELADGISLALEELLEQTRSD